MRSAEAALAHLDLVDRRHFFGFETEEGFKAAVLAAATPQWKGRHPAEDGHLYWAHALAGFIRAGALLAPRGALTSSVWER